MKHKRLTRRVTAALLCAAMGFTGAAAGMPVMDSYAAWYDMENGSYQLPDGTPIEGVIARGIDVSRWQGNIDWNAVAADNVEFVMLGTRSKGMVDPFFHANVKGASDAGIRVGAYIYSLATTPEMAVAEADFVLDLVKEYPVSFPIAFDAEDSGTLGTLPPEEVSEIIRAFCEHIKAAGYYPIIYANDNWLANKIDMSTLPYDVWVARYGVKHNYSDPIMWQATSSGSVDGISGNVDINFLYSDLSEKLPGNLWRTIGDKTYYYKDYVMQKDSWINDGTGWFYMNSDGLASGGWLEKADLTYYLDETTGRMVTGWKQLDNKWYFFNGSGAMCTGWIDESGARYYFNGDGTMATGWLGTMDGSYYLDELSGKMVTGWKEYNGKWYFLQDNGLMATGWLLNNGAKYFLNTTGEMAYGWHMDGTAKYYLTESGAAAIGWRQIDGSWYYFNQNGEMASGWIQPDGNWYYLDKDGKMMTGWQVIDGSTYYLSLNSGKMTTGWREVDGAWYYFSGSGAMVTGLTEINGQIYYLNPADGKMAVSTVLDFDGVDYAVDANGVCTKVEEGAADGNGMAGNTVDGNAAGGNGAAGNPTDGNGTAGGNNATGGNNASGGSNASGGQPADVSVSDAPQGNGSQSNVSNTAPNGSNNSANNSGTTDQKKEVGPGIK